MLKTGANAIKDAIRERRKINGLHLSFPAPDIIELVAETAVDYIYLDGEHGAFTGADLAAGCRTAELHGLTPAARLPNGNSDTVTYYLDRGVRCLIIPHVETIGQARRVVDAAYFAPLGNRSYGASRPEFGFATMPYAAEYLARCNARTAVSLMIESTAGLEIAGELAAIDGVDYFSFGIFDLAQALGFPGQPNHPEVTRPIEEASQAARAAGKVVREDFISFVWIGDLIRAAIGRTFETRSPKKD